MKYLIAILFTFLVSPGWANDSSALQEQQQRLRQLLDKIDKSNQERTQHNARLQRLEHQQACNWSLIQDYKACEQRHSALPSAYLPCTQQAKDKAAVCLAKE